MKTIRDAEAFWKSRAEAAEARYGSVLNDAQHYGRERDALRERVAELEAGIRRYIRNTVPSVDDEWTRLGELLNPHVRAEGEK